ncbi:MAG: hypothetical protein FRX48_01201 [Lasallia pustulata]|uniref:Uncharacterized protein n=1 Tax=Lasallia pustulata TaxID=136370 RepID=A0A5M8PZC4_9LECA|nr:MAG: hypothetical protein FRX48_01201 [Lasallia pustulata]
MVMSSNWRADKVSLFDPQLNISHKEGEIVTSKPTTIHATAALTLYGIPLNYPTLKEQGSEAI